MFFGPEEVIGVTLYNMSLIFVNPDTASVELKPVHQYCIDYSMDNNWTIVIGIDQGLFSNWLISPSKEAKLYFPCKFLDS